MRSKTLPTAPPIMSASAKGNARSFLRERKSQINAITATKHAIPINNQRCQPDASPKKLNAAPVLYAKVKFKNGKMGCAICQSKSACVRTLDWHIAHPILKQEK